MPYCSMSTQENDGVSTYMVRIWEVPNMCKEKELGSIEMILQDSKAIGFMHPYPSRLLPGGGAISLSFRYLLNAERLDDIYLFDMIAKVVEKEDPMNLVTSKIRKPNVWLLC
ncbi:hypothetical protein AHAS_Ahas16G0238300 [Arachis hypogaea]